MKTKGVYRRPISLPTTNSEKGAHHNFRTGLTGNSRLPQQATDQQTGPDGTRGKLGVRLLTPFRYSSKSLARKQARQRAATARITGSARRRKVGTSEES